MLGFFQVFFGETQPHQVCDNLFFSLIMLQVSGGDDVGVV